MATKEDSELNTIKKACQVTVDVFSKYVKEQVMDIIDSDKKVCMSMHFNVWLLDFNFRQISRPL